MLDLGRYLLGVGEIALLAAFAALGASSLRTRFVPELTGSAALVATLVLALALLIWSAELLGTFGAWSSWSYLATVAALSVGLWALCRGWRGAEGGRERTQLGPPAGPPWPQVRTRGPKASSGPVGRWANVPTLIALAIATLAVVKFGADVRLRLDTGMTGFDSTWYHGPFAAGFFQDGDTWGLHRIAPQFMAWFYPANAELFHAIGMGAFDRDLLSPLLNQGWFIACLLACWAIGRPFRMAPASLALGAVALSVPALSDQAGEARNDIVGIFFLLAAVAISLNAWPRGRPRGGLSTGALALAGLAVGLAAGTKLNFLLPAAVLVVGLAAIAPAGGRGRALAATGLGAIAGGGYWYLRNLAHAGNPLPWFDSIGPVSLPGPRQDLGGREGHSVLSYLTDGGVWSDWFLPGLHQGLGPLWPLLGALALTGLVLCLSRSAAPPVRIAALAGLAAIVAWLVAPTSASGPEGIPRGFESGLRYLAPALVLGLALLPASPWFRSRSVRSRFWGPATQNLALDRRPVALTAVAVLLAAVGVGYAVQREYLRDRYANPTFATPGLNAAFKWSTPLSGARIATTSTRQYPLFGAELSNRVEFVGEERSQGGFVAPSTCEAWRNLLNAGDYDYVIASRDRVEPGKPPFPPTARWTESPNAELVLAVPPTKVFKLAGYLDPSACPR